jgi:hypothetical protein
MKAKFNKNAKQSFNSKHRKDVLKEAYTVLDGDFKTVVDCRVYGAGSTAYACLWVYGKGNFYASGSGKAGGWGYHKTSAAVDDAIASAGFELYGSPYNDGKEQNYKKRCNISGVGDSAIEAALMAIAKTASRKRKLHLFRAYA